MNPINQNLWVQPFPLAIMGMQLGRTVSVIRLDSGKTIIHSTAPFRDSDIRFIKSLGEPGWLVEATNFHDTFAKKGREAFPDIPYLAPSGFPEAEALRASSLEAPSEWENEVEVIPIRGMPKINEHVFFLPPSRTLLIADLVFHLPPETDWWTRVGLRLLSGIREFPGNSRLFRSFIEDRSAFEDSLREILSLEFTRLIPAHGVPMEGPNLKDEIAAVFRALDFTI